jgi:hypothetical protein
MFGGLFAGMASETARQLLTEGQVTDPMGIVVSGIVGAGTGAIFGGLGYKLGQFLHGLTSGTKGVTNNVPERMARVIRADLLGSISTIGPPAADDVFVAAADDIAGISSSGALAERLTLVDEFGNLIEGPFAILEFDTPVVGVASPIFRSNPGFVGGGLTAGGAREFVIPNLKLSELTNLAVKVIQ